MKLAGDEAHKGKNRNAYRILVGEPEGKRSLGKPRYRWEDITSMSLSEIEWVRLDWIVLAQG
jgi:hypothetical protein